MKFSLKLLFWIVVVMALGLGSSGYYFINYVFETSMDREIGQALDENSILRFAFETAALNVPAKYDVLPDAVVGQIAGNMEAGGQSDRRLLRVSDEQGEILYEGSRFWAGQELLPRTDDNTKTYQMIKLDDRYYIQTCSVVRALDRKLFLETMKDVSEVFRERALGFQFYRRVTAAILLCGTLIMNAISSWLTRPIRLLTRATKRMASGEYQYRAKKVSDDELGQLTVDFNQMAHSLEENIRKLEEEIRAREDFVGAFAHELKTPLTSIIGYADMIRSRKLGDEQLFASANYIYTEGKRLETMSFRLLDIIVTKRETVEFQMVPVEFLFGSLREMYAMNRDYRFSFSYNRDRVRMEENLIKSVLMNLIDNACKASAPGGRIEIYGRIEKDGYCFAVRDYGIGIPKEEQDKITEAFYMVDKSRSRSKNGAGLGLALCSEILNLHGSRLEIQSEPGQGTCMSFVLLRRWGETQFERT